MFNLKSIFISFIAILVVSLMISNVANAGFGIKGGTTSSTWNVEVNEIEVDGQEDVSGFTAGFFFPIEVSTWFTFQPELLYSQKGVAVNVALASVCNFEFTTNYVELPTLFKFSLPINDTIYPNIFLGPYAAYLIDSEMSVNGVSVDTENFLNDFDAGVLAGAGIDFKVAGHKITLEGRYSRGMVNITNVDSDNEDIKNESVMFLVGFTF